MVYIGIDNGLNGGIVVIDDNQQIVEKLVMPTIKVGGKTEYDVNEIVNFFNGFFQPNKMFAALEKAHVRPVSGKRACFMNGFGYGIMQGLLESLNIPYEIVSPNDWMKEILTSVNTKDKKGSIMWCKRKYPKEDWTASKRSTKPHDGLTDACCLAVYCYRKNR